MAYISSAGTDNLKSLIDKGEYYVDKTLAIKEMLEAGGDVFLMTRPRRFGKTLMLTMLQYFFEKSEIPTDYLFKNKKIWNQAHPTLGPYKDMQGKYPVITLNFKDIESKTWPEAYEKFTHNIAREFKRHDYLLKDSISTTERTNFENIINRTATRAEYEESIASLSGLLSQHHKQKTIFLLDEYDVPIHASYVHGYYEDIIAFMKPLLSAILKSNVTLAYGFITGALHIAKAGLFTGLNNLNVFTITSTVLTDKFGFTDQEVKTMLADANLSEHYTAIKAWYNGYHMGIPPDDVLIYNPWSIVKCLQSKGHILPYWANSSNNLLLRRVLGKADTATKIELEQLLKENTLTKEIDASLIMPALDYDASSVWTLLLFTGYVTYTAIKGPGSREFSLTLPNEEIKDIYFTLLKSIFSSSISGNPVHNLLIALKDGDTESVQELVEDFVVNTMSFFDIPEKTPERSYHLFVLGLLATLKNDYDIKSNRESGHGRYDVRFIPRHTTNTRAFIIEFKVAKTLEQLATAADEAIQQIIDKDYIQEINDRGFNDILLYGMAFYKKKVLVKLDDHTATQKQKN